MIKKEKTKNITMKEEDFPSINVKRLTYRSSTIRIVIDTPLEDKNEYGFLENDIPEYAK